MMMVIVLRCGLLALGVGLDMWTFHRASSGVMINGSWFWSGSVREIAVEEGRGKGWRESRVWWRSWKLKLDQNDQPEKTRQTTDQEKTRPENHPRIFFVWSFWSSLGRCLTTGVVSRAFLPVIWPLSKSGGEGGGQRWRGQQGWRLFLGHLGWWQGWGTFLVDLVWCLWKCFGLVLVLGRWVWDEG